MLIRENHQYFYFFKSQELSPLMRHASDIPKICLTRIVFARTLETHLAILDFNGRNSVFQIVKSRDKLQLVLYNSAYVYL